ncbi:MT-A70 family [Sodiomyces alkalinus F11]|uniref:MT-A70 family n=1 Tax=Sodiomyces alkalinus (strain CBS 110278 / VKM F-3762 / F11) TaxID=1314773 RepID=A0A3N2Q1N2_SODAK|nr:MT-A70 family [Sodiomyces alkalinus F11]ROT40660.1 MT-A70 family [Sodiomyces alkalinus F11]
MSPDLKSDARKDTKLSLPLERIESGQAGPMQPPCAPSSSPLFSPQATRDESCILFHDESKSVILLDIPRSLEEAQVLSDQTPPRRLLSAEPISTPFLVPEPRDAEIRQHAQSPSTLLADLMTRSTVRRALETLNSSYTGPFCLPRRTTERKQPESHGESASHWFPEGAKYVHGTIEEKREEFLSKAPVFDLIILDPPWPNRSAKRKRGGYPTTRGVDDTRRLLSQIPVGSHLAPDGLVAVWVTNKPSLMELLTAPTNGILAEWGLEVAVEWTWLKVTAAGEPLYDLESTWRKPWERLIVARRVGSSVKVPQRVVVAVPDMHSRKPNLRRLFDDVLGPGFRGLEVFARNLTAGWWSWGDSVLESQKRDCWVLPEES